MKIAKRQTVAVPCLLLGLAAPLLAQEVPVNEAPPAVYQPDAAPAPSSAETSPGQQPPPIYLSLNNAIALALQRNLDLKVELFNPAIGEADIRRSLGIYDPLLAASASYSRTATPNTFSLSPSPSLIDQYSASAGVTQLLPTGGTVGASGSSGWVSDSVSYFSSGSNLSVSQPLLRNFGRETTELNINVARLGKEGSLDRFTTRLSDTVAQVRNDYFRLYNLREVLAVQRQGLVLANKILDETRGRVRAGVLPAMEILNAEFGAATREKAVIDAERAVKDQMDVLRLSLQLDPAREIVVVDQPTRDPLTVAEQDAIAVALKSRPELAAQRTTIRVNDLQQRVAHNRTRPDLTVNANVGTAGFAGAFTRSLVKAARADDVVWGAGLQFSYPIGNRAAENDYIRSKLTLEQSQTQLQSLESGVVTDVKAAVRLVGTSYRQLDVTARGRAYAEQRLDAFRKKNAVGLATTKDVIDVENDLVAAEGNQIQALVDYNNAITQLWHATGTLLEKQGITVTDQQADALYQSAQ